MDSHIQDENGADPVDIGDVRAYVGAGSDCSGDMGDVDKIEFPILRSNSVDGLQMYRLLGIQRDANENAILEGYKKKKEKYREQTSTEAQPMVGGCLRKVC